MKNTFKSYLSLVVVLLLSTLAHLQANATTSNTSTAYAVSHFNTSYNYTKKSLNATILPYHKNSDERRNVEIIESNKVEDEEASTKKQFYKDFLETSFINALLFEHASKHLEKNIYRPQSDINESRLRLHVQFQVFII
ncbi:hypothetical protein [Winogradskyella sediminis]|uniref:Uncharacterized protein n=1 Tax=Winogradskyella sediminis TaxID=1382466 RepID=A0A1H1VUG9_9FLAO|nr:hypothetical protein [Winogradskyella sediminis]SDS88554.1 hypothetical protein SAMN04489797_2666 [Winogradskyella sediminis]